MKEKQVSDYRFFFDYLYNYYADTKFIHSDPLEYYYLSKGNKEYSSFIASVFAYGRVPLIKKFLASLFNEFGEYPIYSNFSTKLYYRFQKSYDIEVFLKFLSEIYKKYGNIENCFLNFSQNLEDALLKFNNYAHNFGKLNYAGKGFYFLFPNTEKSASKRMRMFLRWMIRKDNVDPGIWHSFLQNELYYPLDTHILRFSLNNGIVKSHTNSYYNMVKITNFFKEINYEDPVKYDFAISRLGIILSCPYKKSKDCLNCIHFNKCVF